LTIAKIEAEGGRRERIVLRLWRRAGRWISATVGLAKRMLLATGIGSIVFWKVYLNPTIK
jgi:hypothetical protein